MASLFEQEEWLNAVAILKQKAAEFELLERRVKDTFYIAKDSPELLEEYESLLFKGNAIRVTIEKVTKGIDYIFRTFNSNFDGADISNLGFIPLVPIAVILSAIGGITYWINDSLKYLHKIDEIKRIEGAGYSVREAYQMVNEKSFFQSLLDSKYLLMGSGLVLLLIMTRKK